MSSDPPTGPVDDEILSDLITNKAREYYRAGFDNPERIGCPPKEQLTAAARPGRMPDEKLRLHLLACSQCLREFRQLREARKPLPAVRPRTPHRFRLIAAGAALAAFLVLLFRRIPKRR